MKPTQEQVIAWAREAGLVECDCCLPFWPEDDQPNWEIFFERLAALAYEAGRAAVRKHILDTVEELYNSEFDRHPMFSEGYNYALDHFEQFSKGAKS